ncbi:MAG: hypothetical protein MJ179_02605 [Treponema sp.]|nr:hypothetical protein [Treponema sp.]
MVMYKNATILIASLTTIKNSEGVITKGYNFETPLETIRADVQPNNLTSAQIDLYGINSKIAETKKCFFDKANYMTKGNRAKVLDDNGSVKVYEIQPVAQWRTHSEVLLIPVENE